MKNKKNSIYIYVQYSFFKILIRFNIIAIFEFFIFFHFQKEQTLKKNFGGIKGVAWLSNGYKCGKRLRIDFVNEL